MTPLFSVSLLKVRALSCSAIYESVYGTLHRAIPRYDQLMNFAWTFMFPIAIVNLFVTGLLVALTSQ